jgi:hypothetical protein
MAMIMHIMIRRPVTVGGESLGRPRPVQFGIAAALVMARMLSKQLWFTKRGYTFDRMAKTVSGYYN